MNEQLKPHMEILSPAQQQLWPELKPTADLGFALYGGTAIALRLGHRPSIDFDFFSERPLNLEALHATLHFLAQSQVLQDRPNTLSVLVPRGNSNRDHVKVSFFGAIDIGRVGEPDTTDDGVLSVASLDDLMATKVKVILQRIEAKDYRDIAAMINAGASLEKGLAAARKMYGVSFQPSESLKAMVYFQGGDLHALSTDEKNILVKAASQVRNLPKVEILDRQLTLTTGRPTSSRLLPEMIRAAQHLKNQRER